MVDQSGARTVFRVEVHKSAEVGAAADELWALIRDWGGMLRWWLGPEEGGLPRPTLVGCELRGHPEEVPRTRVMRLDGGVEVEEELFFQDDDTRRIHYLKAPDAEVSGYVATTWVDPLGASRSVVHIASTMDAHGPSRPAAIVARFEAIYEAMFKGYDRHFEAGVDSVATSARSAAGV